MLDTLHRPLEPLFKGIQEIHIDHPAISWQRHMGAVGFETIQSMHAFSVSLCGKLLGSSSDWQCDELVRKGTAKNKHWH